MNYPLISEYVEAIKAAEDNFEELKNLRPVLGDDGEPVMTSGNFAVVFKIKNEQTGKLHAVKCFLKEQEGRAEAYRMIAEELEYVNSTFLTPIKYLDKELFVDTTQSDETEFPVLLMDWVEGVTLDKYIREHIDDQYELSLLAYQFSRLAMWLMPQPFAHGDLKPDNILVKKDGTLVMVDYDGMFVPAMKGQKARELGSPDFRHPNRTEADFDEHIDDFSLASILLSLKAISLQSSLFEEYGASDRLLFSANDYRNISESEALNALRPLMQDAELTSLYSLFTLAISQNNLSQVSFRLFYLARPDKSQFEEKNLSTEVTKEDLANAWTDEYGVKYSKDKKRLFLIPTEITDYRIRKGTKVICDYAFGNHNFSGKINNNLRSIYLPASIKVISSDTLCGSQYLSQIIVDENNSIFDSRDNCNAIIRTDNNELLLGCQSTVIPSSISVIADNAFLSCVELKTIVIPSSVEYIGESAFMNCCQLKKIHLPASVKKLGIRAFNGCDIESVSVDKDNRIYDSRDNCNAIIFSADNRLVFGCKRTIIPDTVSEIGFRAFECCELKELNIPNRVKTIQPYAFLACSELRSIIFQSSLTCIDNDAFSCCFKLSSITFNKIISKIVFDAFSQCNSIEIIKIPIGTRTKFENLLSKYKDKLVEQDEDENLSTEVTDEDLANAWTDEFGVKYSSDRKRLLKASDNIKEYVIKEGTKVICNCAFKGCKKLSLISIPYGIIVIGDSAFWHKDQFKTVVIPDSVISIGKLSFFGCSGLESIKLSSNLISIGDRAFYSCAGLTYLSIPSRTEKIGESAFTGCIKLNRIIVEPNNKNYDSRDNCNAIINSRNNTLILGCSSTIIPNTVTKIGDESFFLCKGLESIIIPDSVRVIGYAAFPGCENLASITISQNVDKIGNSIFVDCKSLIQVDILGQIKKLPYRTFYNCEALLHVSIPGSVKELGAEVFYGCSNLQSIFIPVGTRTKFEELLPEYKDKLVEQEMGWIVKDTRPFDPEEIAAVKSAVVVSSQYGNSVCFYMNSGGQTYISLSKQSKLAVGDELDLKTAKIITLSRKGKDDINRVIE